MIGGKVRQKERPRVLSVNSSHLRLHYTTYRIASPKASAASFSFMALSITFLAFPVFFFIFFFFFFGGDEEEEDEAPPRISKGLVVVVSDTSECGGAMADTFFNEHNDAASNSSCFIFGDMIN
jgi:hypothetical protein